MRRIVAALVALLLIGMAAPRAGALEAPVAQRAETPEARYGEEAVQRMTTLKVISEKDLPGYYTLVMNQPFTRAQVITLLVRALGRQEEANLLKGAPVFPDTASHWASGYIAMATKLAAEAGGAPLGLPDQSFRPDDRASAAEVAAFAMKLLGVRPQPGKGWPAGYMDRAAEVGMLPATLLDNTDNRLLQPAPHRVALVLLDHIFYHYDIGAGRTVYTKYVDPVPPLLLLDEARPAGEHLVIITGIVKEAGELYIGTTPVTPDAEGRFTYTWDWGGKPNSLEIRARDIAGNVTEKAVSITSTQ